VASDRGAPVVDREVVTFRLTDPARRLAAVRLAQEVGLRGDLAFAWRAGTWELAVPLPAVDRMEYLFEIVEHGRRKTITDPGNTRLAGGAFGQKSVVVFAGYREPAWLAWPGVAASSTSASIGDIPCTIWTPEGLAAGEPAPLLLVHDGPEYASLGSFTTYLGALIAHGAIPPLRAALLAPVERNAWYSANTDYADRLCAELVPALDNVAPATVRIGVGVSLGALALLHAHDRHPDTFGGLLLQSGSFFTPELDPQEKEFSGFGAVTQFVAKIEDGSSRPVPTVMTCGGVEENLANNQSMAKRLSRLGYSVDFVEVRDAHNYTAWRDALDPAFTDLLLSLGGNRAS